MVREYGDCLELKGEKDIGELLFLCSSETCPRLGFTVAIALDSNMF